MEVQKTGTNSIALSEDAREEIALIAKQCKSANNLMMKVINMAGSKVEAAMNTLPEKWQSQFNGIVESALMKSYNTATWTNASIEPKGTIDKALRKVSGDIAHRIAATTSGAIGGIAGAASSWAEIPIAVTLIFRSIQNIASEYGEDPSNEEVKLECLKVFGSSGPMNSDDSVDVGFIGAKVSLTGTSVQKLIAGIAPKFGAVLSQKLAAQTVPVIGAVSGAGINYTFITYYQQMAHVRFNLRKLAKEHGIDPVLGEFKTAMDGSA